MKQIINTVLLLFCCIGTLFAQDALAELHFEEAKKAYNAQRYDAVIQKLDEIEAIAGPSSQTLYLRISTQDKLLRNNRNTRTKQMLHTLRSNTQTYLEVMAEHGLDDRYREVYAIQEKYKSYPDDPKEWPITSDLYRGEDATTENGVAFLESYEFYDENRFYQLYPSGNLHSRGEIRDGVKVGFWELYDATDNVVWRSAIFDQSNPNLVWYEYSKAYQYEQQQVVTKNMEYGLVNIANAGILGAKKKKSQKKQGEIGNFVVDHVASNSGSPQQPITIPPQQEGFSFRMIFKDDQRGVLETIMHNNEALKVKNVKTVNGRTIEEHFVMLSNTVVDHLTIYIDNRLVVRFMYNEGQMSASDAEEYVRIMDQLK